MTSAHVDTIQHLHYIGLHKLSGLRVLVWGKASTRRQEEIMFLVRPLVFATLRPGVPRPFALASPNP